MDDVKLIISGKAKSFLFLVEMPKKCKQFYLAFFYILKFHFSIRCVTLLCKHRLLKKTYLKLVVSDLSFFDQFYSVNSNK